LAKEVLKVRGKEMEFGWGNRSVKRKGTRPERRGELGTKAGTKWGNKK
jgi:hypothetical protein